MCKLIDNYNGTVLFVGDYQDCLEQYNNFYEDHPHVEDIYIEE